MTLFVSVLLSVVMVGGVVGAPIDKPIWHGDRGVPEVFFTFDDGPHPDDTPQLLALLDEYGVKATFFVMGRSVSRYPDLVRDIVRRGHLLANHTYTHTRLDTLSFLWFGY